MADSVRLFVAIDPGDELRDALAADLAVARRRFPSWRWVRAENVHLTLRFLGATAPARVSGLGAGLSGMASRHGPLALALSTTWGAFPAARRARVLWRGLAGDLTALDRLAADAESWARGEGYEPETRPFRSHLTLARAGRAGSPRAVDLDALPSGSAPAFVAREIVLYQSDLGQGGARYRALARLPLDADLVAEDSP